MVPSTGEGKVAVPNYRLKKVTNYSRVVFRKEEKS